jgi:hypothetical protein
MLDRHLDLFFPHSLIEMQISSIEGLLNICQSLQILQMNVVWALEDCARLMFEGKKLNFYKWSKSSKKIFIFSFFFLINQQVFASSLTLNKCFC